MSGTPTLESVDESAISQRYVAWAQAEKASGGVIGRQARVVADYLRHMLYRLGVNDGKAGAVHIQKLLTAVRGQLAWLVPPTDEPPWAERDESDDDPGEVTTTVKGLVSLSLERLVLLGDCGKQGEGYYISAPVRRVVLGSGQSIVVGGMDTASLARHSGGRVGWAGLARTVQQPTREFPELDVRSWLGTPPETLPEWTRQEFARAEKSLRGSPGRAGSEFEIYSPLSFRNRGQSNRWSSPRQWTEPPRGSSGLPPLHLCRTRRRPRSFWLAPLEQHSQEARFQAEVAIPRASARRLMYGIDLLLGAPTRAEVLSNRTETVEFRLYSWLPTEEYRLFTALCYQSANAPDTPLPFIFHLPSGFWPDVAAALKGLGITIPDPRP